ncbi:MAG: hypothetical protein ACTSPY_17050 [Candidatus Helarchaeota archaeon]
MLILPGIPLLVGYLFIKRKLIKIYEINITINPKNKREILQNILKIDKIGALYLFIKELNGLNEEDINLFYEIFKNYNKRMISKLFRLANYFADIKDFQKEVFALFLSKSIYRAIQVCLEKNLLPELMQILKYYPDLNLKLLKTIIYRLSELSQFDYIFKVLKITNYPPDLINYFSYILFEVYFDKIYTAVDSIDEIFGYDFINRINLDNINDLKGDKKFSSLKQIIEIINARKMDFNDLSKFYLEFLMKNEYNLDATCINKMLNSLYKSTNGFNIDFTSRYDILKFYILNIIFLNNPLKSQIQRYFSKFEAGMSELITNTIIEKINNKINISGKESIDNTEYLYIIKEIFLENFSYSGFNYFIYILIRILFNIRKRITNFSKIKDLFALYLKASNDYWNDILIKIFKENIKFQFLSDWDESIKNNYILYVIKQIAILRCKLFYRSVDLGVLSKDQAYRQVLELLNNLGIASKNSDKININKSFIDGILIKSGWKF